MKKIVCMTTCWYYQAFLSGTIPTPLTIAYKWSLGNVIYWAIALGLLFTTEAQALCHPAVALHAKWNSTPHKMKQFKKYYYNNTRKL